LVIDRRLQYLDVFSPHYWPYWGTKHVWGRGEVHIEFWWRNFGRHRRRWEDNIKMDVGIGMRVMDWTDLAQNMNRWPALVNAVTNLRAP